MSTFPSSTSAWSTPGPRRGSRDAGHTPDRGCRGGYQRRQARGVDFHRVACAGRSGTAARDRSASGRIRSARESGRYPQPSTGTDRGSDDCSLRRSCAADHDVRGRIVPTLRHHAAPIEDDLKPLLEQIDGVAAVEVNGGEVREIQVDLDPRRLEALGLPVSVVAEKLAAENLDLPGGQMQRPGQTISLRTKGEFETADEIEQVILRSDSGSTVRIRDVGRVVDGFEERTSTTRLNGADAVSFSIKKQSGANTAAIAERIHATLDRLRSNFPALRISAVHDDAEFHPSEREAGSRSDRLRRTDGGTRHLHLHA